jgi:2-isopropylmalate synthase
MNQTSNQTSNQTTNQTCNQNTSQKIYIFDTTLRDGIQAPGIELTLDKKIELARNLDEAGVDILEVGFPASSKQEFQDVVAIIEQVKNAQTCVLSRCHKNDIDLALKALVGAKNPRIHVFYPVSNIHLEQKVCKTKQEAKAIMLESLKYVKENKTAETKIQFGLEDSTRADLEFLKEIVQMLTDEGVDAITIADTTGFYLPNQTFELLSHLTKITESSTKISFHCHNDLGLASANAIEAIRAGVTQIEVSVGGIGERAGNCPLEQLIAILMVHPELGQTNNFNTSKISSLSSFMQTNTSYKASLNTPIVGLNCFRHSSGIHTDGMLKNVNTYQIMDPKEFGFSDFELCFDRHSGQALVRHLCEKYNLEISCFNEDDFFKLFEACKNVSQSQAEPLDRSQIALLHSQVLQTVFQKEVLHS